MAREALPSRLANMVAAGESGNVEFRKSMSKGVLESICALSNAEGGYVFSGLKRDGTVLGTDKKQRKDFQRLLSDAIRPEVAVTYAEYEKDGKTLVCIRVPSSSQVIRCSDRIFLRVGNEDVDITDNQDAVFRLYARKTSSSFLDSVTPLGPEVLRADLLSRIVPEDMTQTEYLGAEGFLSRDRLTLREGVTIAAVLLFGPDSAIREVLPQYRTEIAVNNERSVLSTNLIETYEKMTAVLPGDKVLEALCSNMLIHRDYSSPLTARLTVLGKSFTSENASVPKGYDEVFIKNPQISRAFRAMGLATETGEGMRTLRKYGALTISDGQVFKVSLRYVEKEADDESRVRLSPERLSSLLDYCSEPRTRKEIQDFLGIRTVEYVRKRIIKPMLLNSLVARTLPDKPNSRNQKYIRI